MTVEVLLSCMHLNTDAEIMDLVRRTNIKGKAVVVSQCDKDAISSIGDIKIIYTTERGLSRSRNMAISNSTGDICILCDDDEILDDNYISIISNAHRSDSGIGVIAFFVERDNLKIRTQDTRKCKLNYKRLCHVSSVQITFKREIILSKDIKFDIMLGSGTGNGAGEENKFLLDCRKNSIPMIYIPIQIAKLIPSTSNWFTGYNKDFFINDGWSNRRVHGTIFSIFCIFYYVITHRSIFDISVLQALRLEFKGWREKR